MPKCDFWVMHQKKKVNQNITFTFQAALFSTSPFLKCWKIPYLYFTFLSQYGNLR